VTKLLLPKMHTAAAAMLSQGPEQQHHHHPTPENQINAHGRLVKQRHMMHTTYMRESVLCVAAARQGTACTASHGAAHDNQQPWLTPGGPVQGATGKAELAMPLTLHSHSSSHNWCPRPATMKLEAPTNKVACTVCCTAHTIVRHAANGDMHSPQAQHHAATNKGAAARRQSPVSPLLTDSPAATRIMPRAAARSHNQCALLHGLLFPQ